MKFLPLFSVHLMHSYYADGRCTDFDFEPTLHTQRLLTNARCVLRALPDGIRVLTAVTDRGVPLIPLPQDAALVFHLRPQNPDFILFTDLTGRPSAAPLYTNAGLTAGDELQLALRPRHDGVPDPGVFADIVICQNDTVPPRASTRSVFSIPFKAKEVHWTYYVISGLSKTAGEWQIVDTDTSAVPRLTFSAANRTDLTQSPAPSDEIVKRLASQYPHMQRWRLVSDTRIPCQQAARKHLQLTYNGQRVWGALPNPALQHYAMVAVNINGTPQPQETLFHVVAHLTHALPTRGV
jgi:hypothetical protein